MEGSMLLHLFKAAGAAQVAFGLAPSETDGLLFCGSS